MPSKAPTIDIPPTNVWSTLFDRPSKPFPDSQVIYTDALTQRSYTFAQLRTTTISFGWGLQTHPSLTPFHKGDVLALFAANCIDTPAVTWGTHWAGGIVSPANPAYHVRELAFHLRDCGAKVLVTQKHLLSVAVEAAKEVGLEREKVLLMGEEREEGFVHFGDVVGVGERGGGERVKVDPERDLAFLVYSSGTTGLPKGVMLSHRNVVSNLLMVNSSEGSFLSWEKDKILSVLPYYHIYGLQCIVHLPAYTGIPTVVMSSFSLPSFLALIQDHKITYTYVAPPIILHLAKSPLISNYNLSSLHTITSGAAPLTKELIHSVHTRLNIAVKQAYGLSETSPVTHMQRQWDIGLGSNGPALPNQVIKFVDPAGQEVDVGKEGELYIQGPNVFMGYLNNEPATKACMTPDGFFKTGDVGYQDAEGNMYITDRVKELIKYKGFQVAPAELEGVLSGMELVQDVAVIGVMDRMRETEVPLACVVLREGVEEGKDVEKRIVEWLGERVAAHKRLRGGVVFVDEVPKSASGKILRRLLREKVLKEREVKAKL